MAHSRVHPVPVIIVVVMATGFLSPQSRFSSFSTDPSLQRKASEFLPQIQKGPEIRRRIPGLDPERFCSGDPKVEGRCSTVQRDHEPCAPWHQNGSGKFLGFSVQGDDFGAPGREDGSEKVSSSHPEAAKARGPPVAQWQASPFSIESCRVMRLSFPRAGSGAWRTASFDVASLPSSV